MKYNTVADGEWVRPKRQGYKMMCCDCGLVHKFDFLIFGKLKNIIQFRAFRDNRATGQRRRWMKKHDNQDIKKIRDYFGGHDKTAFEHWAYNFLDKLIKEAHNG